MLERVFADGSRKLYGTDTQNWKAGIAGPVKHAGIYDGEEYDARVLPGFETPDKLGVPEINTEFAGGILPMSFFSSARIPAGCILLTMEPRRYGNVGTAILWKTA